MEKSGLFLLLIVTLSVVSVNADGSGWYITDPNHYKRWRKWPKRFDGFYAWRWNHDAIVDFDTVPPLPRNKHINVYV
ncbi:Hypothetical predicted protein [Cloeon dipterum]|uniref:Uncharacterized protein n=1 Tax=Cloeon dipterum TaxID=197152 RepID=A0A8S1CGJ9_9INSE|nr:Hypothetical predicted protein [Cloeon dipterum]